MTTQFQMTQGADGVRTLTFIGQDGSFHTVNSRTPGFDATLSALMVDDVVAATAAAVPLTHIVDRLRAISPSFDTDGDVVTRNGKALSPRLSLMLLGYARSGDKALVALTKFIDRLDYNPSKRSVESLYDWIDSAGLTLNEDGHIVGYKGVRERDGGYVSVHSGSASVNGVLHKGQIPNAVGDVITMPRNQVQDDPSVGCHQGLHVGSHNYANSFGSVLLTVTVDPADVVSVPTDCNAEKMRVCRYQVVAVNSDRKPYGHTVVTDYSETDDGCDCPWCEGH